MTGVTGQKKNKKEKEEEEKEEKKEEKENCCRRDGRESKALQEVLCGPKNDAHMISLWVNAMLKSPVADLPAGSSEE